MLPFLFRWQPSHPEEGIARWLPPGEVAFGSRSPTGAGEIEHELVGAGVCNLPKKGEVA